MEAFQNFEFRHKSSIDAFQNLDPDQIKMGSLFVDSSQVVL